MDSFSLLKYWRGGGGAAAFASIRAAASIVSPTSEAAALAMDDDGPFFDIEFTVSDRSVSKTASVTGDDDELSVTMGSSEEADVQSDAYFSFSPSDHLFFNGKLIATGESDLRSQLSVSLLRSATRFRVFMLRLRRSKSPAAPAETGPIGTTGASPKQSQQVSKFFVRFKVEEVPIVSLFSRSHVAEEKKSGNSKEVVQKYIRKIKPLYVRVSKRYGEKMRFSGPLKETRETEDERETTNRERKAKSAMATKLRVAYKRLGKSKSGSAVVVSAASPPNPPQRQDDSLLQQDDGIQSAIAHCKRSFSAAINESKSPLTCSTGNPERVAAPKS